MYVLKHPQVGVVAVDFVLHFTQLQVSYVLEHR
jgi:hypothetical protein